MFYIERKSELLKLLERTGKIRVNELSTSFKSSRGTIRRDLREMEEKDLLKRTHGGAVLDSTFSSAARVASFPEEDYEIPLGTVAVKREGSDLTLLANMLMLHRAMETADELARQGIHAEVIDMRCLVPLDMAPLIASAQKTGHVLIVEEDNLTGGWGAEVAARLSEAAFFHLDAPITRVAAPTRPHPLRLPWSGSMSHRWNV